MNKQNTKILNSLKKIINETISKNYKKSQKKTVRERYKGMSEGLKKIMNIINENWEKEAIRYYDKRTKSDERLKKIQKKAFDEIKKCIKDAECFKNIKYVLVPASSFSAKTNLIGESDIDFGILIKNIDEDKAMCLSNALGKCNYLLTDIRNQDNKSKKHWVFQKYINNVEIEGKVRDYDGFKNILKMHTYTDKKMGKKDKMLTTYTKYILKKYARKEYENFKMIDYCNAGYHGKSNELLYKLK